MVHQQQSDYECFLERAASGRLQCWDQACVELQRATCP
jgi:hypothetical protein